MYTIMLWHSLYTRYVISCNAASFGREESVVTLMVHAHRVLDIDDKLCPSPKRPSGENSDVFACMRAYSVFNQCIVTKMHR